MNETLENMKRLKRSLLGYSSGKNCPQQSRLTILLCFDCGDISCVTAVCMIGEEPHGGVFWGKPADRGSAEGAVGCSAGERSMDRLRRCPAIECFRGVCVVVVM